MDPPGHVLLLLSGQTLGLLAVCERFDGDAPFRAELRETGEIPEKYVGIQRES
jgi:hypothetical protein